MVENVASGWMRFRRPPAMLDPSKSLKKESSMPFSMPPAMVEALPRLVLPKPPPGVRYAIDPISAMVVELKTN